MGIGEHFEGVKKHWAKNFAFLDYFKKVYGREEPLPKWKVEKLSGVYLVQAACQENGVSYGIW
uniref:Uncharacterized protein n=1 Tax=Leersia perrieri TaxID=77586 RepID=A0A0D9XFL0_9ORYZ